MYHARIYMLPCYLTTLYLTGKIRQGHLKRNDCYSWLYSCAQVFESVASMSPAHLLLIAYWLADSATPTQHSRGTTYSILHWPGNIKTHQAKTSICRTAGELDSFLYIRDTLNIELKILHIRTHLGGTLREFTTMVRHMCGSQLWVSHTSMNDWYMLFQHPIAKN